MSLDPPKVLLDRSFLHAVVDATDPAHEESVALYRDLVDEFEREHVLLVAVSTHLRDIELGADVDFTHRATYFLHRNHRGVFAPVEPLYVGYQHRRAARGVDHAGVTDLEDALTLVMCERHHITRIASTSDVFDGFRIERVAPTAE